MSDHEESGGAGSDLVRPPRLRVRIDDDVPRVSAVDPMLPLRGDARGGSGARSSPPPAPPEAPATPDPLEDEDGVIESWRLSERPKASVSSPAPAPRPAPLARPAPPPRGAATQEAVAPPPPRASAPEAAPPPPKLPLPSSVRPPPPADAARPAEATEEEIDLDPVDEAKPARAPKPPPPPGPPSAPDPSKPKKKQRPWFEDFFSDDYLRTVRAPTSREVARECDFIQSILSLPAGATILDIGCGLGMHAIELTRRGCVVVGLDLSLPMLSRAGDEAQDADLKINFLHGDMRDMHFDGTFDVVLCWGTTFGYFDDEQNRKVIERFHAALKVGGILLLDVTNRDHVVASQPNLVWFEGDGCVCMEETKFNFISSRLEVKRTVMLDDGRQRDSLYSIRLYALHELGQLLHAQGFRVLQVSGMQATPGVFFGVASPRMIITAERRAPASKSKALTPMPTMDSALRSSVPPPPPSSPSSPASPPPGPKPGDDGGST